MKELKWMIRSGELDRDRTLDNLVEENAYTTGKVHYMHKPFRAFICCSKNLPLVAIDLGYSATSPSCGLAWTGYEPAIKLQFGAAIRKVKELIWENDIQLIVLEAVLSTFHKSNGNPDIRGEFERGRGWYHGAGVLTYASALQFIKMLANDLKSKQVYIAEAFLSNKGRKTSHTEDALLIRDLFWDIHPVELHCNVEPSTDLINGVPSVRVF